jgi:hypothetical protein
MKLKDFLKRISPEWKVKGGDNILLNKMADKIIRYDHLKI